jgi:RNase adaptor protein for sRNA GlmZ degradation
MKHFKFYLPFLFVNLFFSLNCIAQNITLEEMIGLRVKNLDYVESYLSQKSWEITKAQNEDDENLQSVTFGYKVNAFDNEKAVSWIKFYPNSDDINNLNMISIQISDKNIYNIYMNSVKRNNFVLNSTEIIEDGIKKIYVKKNTQIILETGITEGTYRKSTFYKFNITFYMPDSDIDVKPSKYKFNKS